MESASASGTLVLVCSRNYKWYRYSAPDPWSYERQEAWHKYTDVENEIIEDVFREKKSNVEIDGNYIIDFKLLIQQKSNSDKQYSIERVQLDRDRSSFKPREERFSSQVTITSSALSIKTLDSDDNDWYNGSFSNYEKEIEKKNTWLADVVEEAIKGILKEGIAYQRKSESTMVSSTSSGSETFWYKRWVWVHIHRSSVSHPQVDSWIYFYCQSNLAQVQYSPRIF
ncbi:unnamed protein product [Rotaria magnacalcarata]|uniref:WWE domain-containing protein n=1 Tax=Rotaria magnacalcarata TaxID=392030 RepID=A0A819JNB0_9BILA|nr:unnamed protein product [Rotaria magnacalcarata]CAF2050540.1 unnamed protein product [Rotaria magnacalcarata]CAF3935783.1 unnamed protein product [Rotaria magnacalcarata]CAF3952839.1 unnamed protein product [Rotaria magnacalcarata]